MEMNDMYWIVVVALFAGLLLGFWAHAIWIQYKAERFLENQWRPVSRRIRGVQ